MRNVIGVFLACVGAFLALPAAPFLIGAMFCLRVRVATGPDRFYALHQVDD